MNRIKRNSMVVMVSLMVALLGGCAGSYQARSVDLKPETVLVNPDIFVKGTGDQVLYRYVDPKVDWQQYTKIIIDPVIVYEQSKLDKDELENMQKLKQQSVLIVLIKMEILQILMVVFILNQQTRMFV